VCSCTKVAASPEGGADVEVAEAAVELDVSVALDMAVVLAVMSVLDLVVSLEVIVSIVVVVSLEVDDSVELEMVDVMVDEVVGVIEEDWLRVLVGRAKSSPAVIEDVLTASTETVLVSDTVKLTAVWTRTEVVDSAATGRLVEV